jgi:hypothetical protein
MVAAAFMVGVGSTVEAAGSTAEVAVVFAQAAADSAGDPMPPQSQVTAVRVPRARTVDGMVASMRRGPVTATRTGAEDSAAEISGMAIQPRRVLLRQTGNGILLAAHPAAAELGAHKRKALLPETPAASMCLAEIAQLDPPARCAAFPDRAAKFGRPRTQLEM